jgi:hypothetical protein
MKRTHYFVATGVLMFLIMTGQALADCVLNGKRLPEGTRIGSLVCEYGQWVDKQRSHNLSRLAALRNGAVA